MQPDGDLVAILDPEAAPDPVAAWDELVDEVVAWLAGLQRRLRLLAGRLAVLHAGIFGLAPALVALAADGSGGPGALAGTGASAPQLAVVLAAVVSAVDTLRATRSSAHQRVAVSVLPTALAALSAGLHASLGGLVLLALAPALTLVATLVGRTVLRRAASVLA